MPYRPVQLGEPGLDPLCAQAAVEEEQLLIVPTLRRFLPTLATLADLAMLVGLLGTTFGMVSGFHWIGTISAVERAAALAKSISAWPESRCRRPRPRTAERRVSAGNRVCPVPRCSP